MSEIEARNACLGCISLITAKTLLYLSHPSFSPTRRECSTPHPSHRLTTSPVAANTPSPVLGASLPIFLAVRSSLMKPISHNNSAYWHFRLAIIWKEINLYKSIFLLLPYSTLATLLILAVCQVSYAREERGCTPINFGYVCTTRGLKPWAYLRKRKTKTDTLFKGKTKPKNLMITNDRH